MSDVVNLGMRTKLPLPVERILTSESALALSEVLVVGWRADGSLYLAMSDPSMDLALMLLACAERTIIDEVVAGVS